MKNVFHMQDLISKKKKVVKYSVARQNVCSLCVFFARQVAHNHVMLEESLENEC